MSFQKFKTDSYCVGGRHRYSTKNNFGDTISEGSKVVIGYCSVCKRKKSMTVSDNTIEAKGVRGLFKNLGKKGVNVSKKMEKQTL